MSAIYIHVYIYIYIYSYPTHPPPSTPIGEVVCVSSWLLAARLLMMSSVFCANSLTVIQDFCHVCTRSATSAYRNFWTIRLSSKPLFYVLRALNRLRFRVRDLPRHVYLSNNANTARRVSQLKTAKVCENCESERRRVRFVTTVATMAL